MKRAGILVLMMVLAMPLSAGVVYEIETKDHQQGGRVYSTEVYAQGRNIRIGIAPRTKGGGDGDMIFRSREDHREMIVVDHAEQTWALIDKEAVGAIGGQVSSAMSQMEKALENVPEDRRAMVREMMKQRMPAGQPKAPRYELQNTGVREKRLGYPCVKYVVLRDGQKVRVLWVTDWDNLDGGDQIVGAFEDLADFSAELMDSLPRFGGEQSVGDPAWAHMKEIGGFPVVTREYGDDGELESESSLRSSRRQRLDPDAFEPPSGYKRQEMFSPGTPGETPDFRRPE